MKSKGDRNNTKTVQTSFPLKNELTEEIKNKYKKLDRNRENKNKLDAKETRFLRWIATKTKNV